MYLYFISAVTRFRLDNLINKRTFSTALLIHMQISYAKP